VFTRDDLRSIGAALARAAVVIVAAAAAVVVAFLTGLAAVHGIR